MIIRRKEENINSQNEAEMGVRGKRLNGRSQRGSERILIPAEDENIILKRFLIRSKTIHHFSGV